jgi:hypothetical protein
LRASTVELLAELCVLRNRMNPRQVSPYAGLDVRLQPNGTSANRPATLASPGGVLVRFTVDAARSAVTPDPLAGSFYESWRQRGEERIRMVFGDAKSIRGFWACIRNTRPLDSSNLFNQICGKSVDA